MIEESEKKPTGDEDSAAESPTVAQSEVMPANTSSTDRMEGLVKSLVGSVSSTLGKVDHELHIISHASKFEWVNKRLILLRNAVIAFCVIAVAAVTITLC